MKVYLAGGMRKDWRQRVKAKILGPIWLDPTEHGLERPADYTRWDLAAIRQSDVVFAFMEQTNPSGIGLALEVGFAVGLGKPVVLVDESDNCYMLIVREAASVCFLNFDAGIAVLDNLSRR